jgi:hypothetical protein
MNNNIVIILADVIKIYIIFGIFSLIAFIFFLTLVEKRTIKLKEILFMLFCYPYYIFYGYKQLIKDLFINKINKD